MPADPATLVVVGWVLSPIIKEVIDKAKNLATSKYDSFKHFSRQLGQLVDVLEQTSATVQTVEKVQHRIGESNETTIKLVDSLSKVEDILDDFDYDNILRSNMEMEHKVRQVVHSTVKKGRQLIGTDKAFGRLKEMLEELPTIQQSSRDLVQLLQLQVEASSSHADSRRARSTTGPLLPDDELFVGYKEEYDELLSALLDDDPAAPSCSGGTGGNNRNAQVVAVIGYSGSGKTAIAKRAWNDQRVKMGHFDIPIWASVSDKFSKDDLLTEIWKSMPGNRQRSAADMSFSSLQQEVLGLVASQRFLLVLDDVCNDESNDDGDDQMKKTWKDVLAPFRDGKQGSRILMTSRANICSKTLGAGTRITLNGVGTDDLVLLLKKSAFGNQHEDTPDLNDIITSVAEKLKGSPSTAATVADKVRNKYKRTDWLESGCCNEITSVVVANKSSYHSLPRHLQSCLGFCSMFPDKWKFEPETLVKMWIAHGIINDNRSDGRSMEDMGREYIRALHSRSFFKATRQGKATYFVIHEQIHLMLQSVCDNYFFRISDKRIRIPPTVRHLSVTDGCLAQLKKDPVLKQLRTLLVFGGLSAIDDDVLKGLKAVRVLGLASTSITNLPEGIGKLRHLRYLGLPSAVKSLPLAVTELLHLQTLALGKDCKLDDHGFPAKGMSSLINLRHLDMDMKYIAMMTGIGRLEKLQGSVEFCADRGPGHGMEELAGINSLRGTLSVKGLHAVLNKEEAQKAQLGSKEFVKVLKLEWEPKLGRTFSTSSHEQVLEGLEPHCKIGELHIRRYQGTSSPSWLEKDLLASLGHLYLINCRNWKVLPPLSKLPDLRVLHIKEMLSVERIDHDSSAVFQSLEKLVLDDMPNLVEWTAESTIFPCLKEIHILNCPKLEKLPRVPSTVKKMKLENHNSYYLNLSVLKSNYFTLDIHGDAVQLLREDFLHQHHIAAISVLSIKKYKGTSELNINLLASVQSLSLSRCVITDRQLRMWLQRLQSLKRLQISDCPDFDVLPDAAMLSSLRSLELKGCHPMLMEKLRDRTSPTWAKICSIPQVHIH